MATVDDIENIYNSKFTSAISNICSCSTDDAGDTLVNDSSKCIDFDAVKDDGRFEMCSVDALFFNSAKKCLYFIEFKNRDFSSTWYSNIFENATKSAISSRLLNDYIENKYNVVADNDIKKVFLLVLSNSKSSTYFTKVSRAKMSGNNTSEYNALQRAINNKGAFGNLYDEIQIIPEIDLLNQIL